MSLTIRTKSGMEVIAETPDEAAEMIRVFEGQNRPAPQQQVSAAQSAQPVVAPETAQNGPKFWNRDAALQMSRTLSQKAVEALKALILHQGQATSGELAAYLNRDTRGIGILFSPMNRWAEKNGLPEAYQKQSTPDGTQWVLSEDFMKAAMKALQVTPK